jgi:Mg2+ and Co2+ transporter CorA
MDEELHPDELTEEEIEGIHKLERSLETMQEKIDRQADVIKNMSEHYSKAVVKEYERGLAEAQARMELAVEEGDVEGYKAAKAEADSLMENASSTSDVRQK